MADLDKATEAAIDAAMDQMRESVVRAIETAHQTYVAILATAGRSEPPPSRKFFASCVMQLGYCMVCDADYATFRGGDPDSAWHAAKNTVDIANHHWGARFELRRAESPGVTPSAPSPVPSA